MQTTVHQLIAAIQIHPDVADGFVGELRHRRHLRRGVVVVFLNAVAEDIVLERHRRNQGAVGLLKNPSDHTILLAQAPALLGPQVRPSPSMPLPVPGLADAPATFIW